MIRPVKNRPNLKRVEVTRYYIRAEHQIYDCRSQKVSQKLFRLHFIAKKFWLYLRIHTNFQNGTLSNTPLWFRKSTNVKVAWNRPMESVWVFIYIPTKWPGGLQIFHRGTILIIFHLGKMEKHWNDGIWKSNFWPGIAANINFYQGLPCWTLFLLGRMPAGT